MISFPQYMFMAEQDGLLDTRESMIKRIQINVAMGYNPIHACRMEGIDYTSLSPKEQARIVSQYK